MIGDREMAYGLGKEDGGRRARLGLPKEADLSLYSDDYILGYNKEWEAVMDDYDQGYTLGYEDARTGNHRNPTVLKMVRPFRVGYETGFDAYIGDALRFRHDECEAAA